MTRKSNPLLIDETGNTRGVWVVVKRYIGQRGGRAEWLCRCTNCGADKVVQGVLLRSAPPRCQMCRAI